MAASEKNFKIWTATNDSNAGVMVTPKASFLVGDKSNFYAASNTGVAIVGKSISLGTISENIRQGGLFVNMNDFVKMIPQTMVTPIPSEIPFPPLGLIFSVLGDLPFFLALSAS
jgi:hypothetical protein